MARFQLAGPAADVSKILYGESHKSYQSPNAQYDNSGVPHPEAVKARILVNSTEVENILHLDSGKSWG
jgi:hypothetical protein